PAVRVLKMMSDEVIEAIRPVALKFVLKTCPRVREVAPPSTPPLCKLAPSGTPRVQRFVWKALIAPTLPRRSHVPPSTPAIVADATTVPVVGVVLIKFGLKLPRLAAALRPVVVRLPKLWAVRLPPTS